MDQSSSFEWENKNIFIYFFLNKRDKYIFLQCIWSQTSKWFISWNQFFACLFQSKINESFWTVIGQWKPRKAHITRNIRPGTSEPSGHVLCFPNLYKPAGSWTLDFPSLQTTFRFAHRACGMVPDHIALHSPATAFMEIKCNLVVWGKMFQIRTSHECNPAPAWREQKTVMVPVMTGQPPTGRRTVWKQQLSLEAVGTF